MLKTQIDQYDMVLAVEHHLDMNQSLFADSMPIQETKRLLTSKIGLLAIQVAQQLVNSTGVAEQKNKMRDTLENQAFVISAASCSYASASNNGDLYNRCHYTKTDLSRFRDAELVGISTNLFTDINTYASALVPYGVDYNTMMQFQSSINTFSKAINTPTEAIAKRAAATAQIETLLPEIVALLNTRLDNDMISKMASQPNFVAVYQNLRRINSSPTSTLSLTITALDEKTKAPIANVALEILNENTTRKTSARGYSTVLNLIAGTHSIQASHPNYLTKTESFTIVSGETTELVVLMQQTNG